MSKSREDITPYTSGTFTMAVENFIIFNQTSPVTKTVFVEINIIITIYFDPPYVYFGNLKLNENKLP